MRTPRSMYRASLEKTGISNDYWNEYFGIFGFFSLQGKEGVSRILADTSIKNYEERFPFEKYGKVVTRRNRHKVAKLNKVARYVNSKFTEPSNFTDEDFVQAIRVVYRLIYGKPPTMNLLILREPSSEND